MKKISIGIVLIVILIIGFSILNKPSQEVVNNTQNNVDSAVANTSETDESNESDQSNKTSGLYAKYSNDLKQYENKDIILFFKADWCPSCRVIDADIKASLSDIPENVVILELNYDKETDLKKKYGVTTQHIFVQIDTNGDMIKKWSGGNRLEDVLNQIK